MAIATLTLSTGSQQDIITVPSGKRYAITNIMVCNTYDPGGSSPEAETSVFDMHLLPSGEALSTTLNLVRNSCCNVSSTLFLTWSIIRIKFL